MLMKIQFYRKSVYGHDNAYVADKATKKTITGLTRQATISASHRACLEALGFEFEEVLQPK